MSTYGRTLCLCGKRAGSNYKMGGHRMRRSLGFVRDRRKCNVSVSTVQSKREGCCQCRAGKTSVGGRPVGRRRLGLVCSTLVLLGHFSKMPRFR